MSDITHHSVEAPTATSRKRRRLSTVIAAASVAGILSVGVAPAASAATVPGYMGEPTITTYVYTVGETLYGDAPKAYWYATYTDTSGILRTGQYIQATSTKCEWLRGGSTVVGRDCAKYTIQKADYGQWISMRVTGTAQAPAAGMTLQPMVRTSKAQKVTKKGRILGKGVMLSGKSVVGQTLRATPLDVKTTPNRDSLRMKYQWYRDGLPIKNAKRSTYKLTKADLRADIYVRMTASASGYFTETFESAAVDIPSVTAGRVKVQGAQEVERLGNWTVKVNKKLTAKPSGFTGAKTYTYKWMVWDSTKDTYKVLSTSKSFTPKASLLDKTYHSVNITLRVDARPKPGSDLKNQVNWATIHVTK
ncbi:MAG: hypothetical protein LBH13_01865 [Cellulomonadaceae bacterium]|nr:hypothetical protein [Cellulomonadaceae bacterium]